MNKRGFLRIVEASISIVILIGVLFFLFVQTRPELTSVNYDEFLRDLLEEISKNERLRVDVLSENGEEIADFLDRRIVSSNLAYTFAICGVGDACGLDQFVSGEVYAQERVISSDIDYPSYDPKKIRLFIWRLE